MVFTAFLHYRCHRVHFRLPSNAAIYHFGVYAAYAKVFAKQEDAPKIDVSFKLPHFLNAFVSGRVLNEIRRSRNGRTAVADTSWPARNATFLRES